MPIRIPPLRQRKDDIPLLVAHFIQLYRSRHGLRPPHLTESAVNALRAYDWPGNVRELGNAIERLMILYPDRAVDAEDIGSVLPRLKIGTSASQPEGGSLSELLESYERQLIKGALDSSAGNIAEAARRLSTDRPNLYRRMKRLGVQRPDGDDDEPGG
jgi:two-component system nitrogen regulation response regulator NtrX